MARWVRSSSGFFMWSMMARDRSSRGTSTPVAFRMISWRVRRARTGLDDMGNLFNPWYRRNGAISILSKIGIFLEIFEGSLLIGKVGRFWGPKKTKMGNLFVDANLGSPFFISLFP